MAITDCSHNETQLWVIISCLSNRPVVRTKDGPEGDDNGHCRRGFKDQSWNPNISFRSKIICHSIVNQFLLDIMTKLRFTSMNTPLPPTIFKTFGTFITIYFKSLPKLFTYYSKMTLHVKTLCLYHKMAKTGFLVVSSTPVSNNCP